MRVFSNALSNWIAKIKQPSSNSKWQELIFHYNQITQSGLQCIDPTLLFPPLLKACTHLSHYNQAKSLHGQVIKQGLLAFTSIGNSVMDCYFKFRELGSGKTVFNCMRNKDSVSWNILIHGCFNNGEKEEGLALFNKGRRMVDCFEFEPNVSTLVVLIMACRGRKREGLVFHGYLIRSGFSKVNSVQNSLLWYYADDDMKSALKLFDEMSERDVVSWSVVIGGHVQHEEFEDGLLVFKEMLSLTDVRPDGMVMVTVLKACASLGRVETGRLVHGLVILRGLGCDLFLENSLIDMYSKCGDVCSASKVFSDIECRNNVSWNSMISGYLTERNYGEALSLIYSMGKEGIEGDEVTLVNVLQLCRYVVQPLWCKLIHCFIIRRGYELNEFVLNALINAYASCDLARLAWQVFVRMKTRDVALWSSMISAFAQCGRPKEAIAVYREMINSEEVPNAITVINLTEACAVSAELTYSKCAHGVAVRRGLVQEVEVGTAIVNMYSKCGEIEAARKAFDQITQKNVVTWSAMIAAYGMNGLADKALTLQAEMEVYNLKPNPITALSVLSACSHGGLIEKGLLFFKSMIQDHGIELSFEHHSCVVDMLARAGHLDIAKELIELIPDRLKGAGTSAWGSFLSACRSYGNSKLGDGAVAQVLELEPSNSTGYVLASSMYAAEGLWSDAAKMRVLAKERGLRVTSGYSLVQLGNNSCKFLAGDKSHPEMDQIEHVIRVLHEFMKIEPQKSKVVAGR